MKASLYRIRCCHQTSPLGVENPLRFSWNVTGMEQTAYRLRIFAQADAAPVFDSGRVESADPFTPALDIPLESSRAYRYDIAAFGGSGEKASGGGSFETGLLGGEEKRTRFVTSGSGLENPVFRKVIAVGGDLKKARLYVAGLGYYTLRVNGRAVSDAWFQPVVSNYHARDFSSMLYPFRDNMSCSVYYNTLNITNFIHTGDNVLTVELGNGFYNQHEREVEGRLHFGKPKLLLLCKIWDESGLRVIPADTSWRCAPGPAVKNNLFFGEKYDARLAVDDGSPAFDDGGWEHAVIAPAQETVLRAQLCPPDRVERVVRPRCLGQTGGRAIYDCGENLTGVARITGAFASGETRTLRFGEHLTPDGELDFYNAGTNDQIQQDVYIGDGKPGQVYAPRFCWHGFRYFDIDGPADGIEVLKIHSDLSPWGGLRTSDFRLDRITDAFRRSLLSNMHGGVISDCPHRERLGYTGDGQVSLGSAMLLYDGVSFYEKWFRDIADCQCAVSGHIQHTAPFFGGGGGPGGWGCAVILAPWALYGQTGDPAPLREHYDSMERWMGYLASRSEKHIVLREEEGGWCLGDWGFPDGQFAPTEAYVNSCFYGRCAVIMAAISLLLEKEERAREYGRLAEEIRDSVRNRFYDEATALFDRFPLGNVYARYLGVSTPESDRVMLAHYRESERFDTGIFGTPMLLDALAELGEQELALRMICAGEAPSFSYLFDGGETTIREFWFGGESHNHHMFGTVAGFLMRLLLGLPESFAHREWVFRPYLPQGLDHAGGGTMTSYGKVKVSWVKNGGTALLSIDLPSGTRACLEYGGKQYPLAAGNSTVALSLL